MYIGCISKKTGLSIKAIRFYEKIGLIRQPQRKGSYRVYNESDIEVLVLIKEAKELGIALSKLQGVIVYTDGKIDWLKIKIFLKEIKKQFIENIEDMQMKVKNIERCYQQIDP